MPIKKKITKKQPTKAEREQTETLRKRCIREFFFKCFKDIAKCGGEELRSLGVEATLEACYGLFEDKRLILKMFDEKTFYVFMEINEKGDCELIYDSTGRITNG